MKLIARFGLTVSVVLFSLSAFAGTQIDLAGRTYFRQGGRPIGAPPSVIHIAVKLSFYENGKMTDSNSALGGNAPEHCDYSTRTNRRGTLVTTDCNGRIKTYVLSRDESSLSEIGGPTYMLLGSASESGGMK